MGKQLFEFEAKVNKTEVNKEEEIEMKVINSLGPSDAYAYMHQ